MDEDFPVLSQSQSMPWYLVAFVCVYASCFFNDAIICMCVYIYIYIYIYSKLSPRQCWESVLHISICIYVYIYIYIYINTIKLILGENNILRFSSNFPTSFLFPLPYYVKNLKHLIIFFICIKEKSIKLPTAGKEAR